MNGTLFCALAFFSSLAGGMLAWRIGLVILLFWGYVFGIIKAYYISSYGLFVFDAATVGFYVGCFFKPPNRLERTSWGRVWSWFLILLLWPCFMATLPIQHYLVQIVGLRGNIFWIPMILFGVMLDAKGRTSIAFGLAILNMMAMGFSLAEYYLGVTNIIPESDVTKIVYDSNDLAGGSHRIPSCFVNAHTYAYTMVSSIPWIIGEIVDRKRIGPGGAVLLAGAGCAFLGIFMAGPRSPVLVLIGMALGSVLYGRINWSLIAVFGLVLGVVGYFVQQDERFQRYTELQDYDFVLTRLGWSVNMTFFEVLLDYPMGNGIGAGGTSLPGFVREYLSNTVLMENEYARILLEQGLPGLVLWFSFIVWFFLNPVKGNQTGRLTKVMSWFHALFSFAIAVIGLGMMATVPTTMLLFLGIGCCFSPLESLRKTNFPVRGAPTFADSLVLRPAYQRGLAKA